MDIKGRWIDLIHRAATGTKRTRTLLTPVGVLVFGAFMSGAWHAVLKIKIGGLRRGRPNLSRGGSAAV